MIRPRALTWVAWFLYLSVLVAGLVVAASGECDALGLWGFTCGLAVAGALESVESRIPVTPSYAVAALTVRAALFAFVTALDCAGNAKLLFVLIPLTAYFTLGHRIAYGLGAAEVVLATVLVAVGPGFGGDPEAVPDLLMFAVGIGFALTLAVIAGREEAGRRRAESLLVELSDANARLAEYADQAVTLATVAERTRLARDIHDTVGHHLVVTAIQLEKAAAYRTLEPDTADRALTDGRDSARQALEQVRRAVGALHDDTDGFTLATALRALIARLRDTDFTVTLRLSGDEHRVGESVRLALYLVTQEALTNARRHSGADTVTVDVDLTARTLDISDNGRGLRPDAVEGHGLRGMRERLDLVGGRLSITTGSTGTRLLATVSAP
ncbi:sensor histidine kinase [Nocardia sp. NBC_01377]|uniref:sensor histidine kinase n=1 Tax=Nocardia sp. NBC_01377 TaxID=2903595 RepID=UPI0032440578